MTRSGEQRNYYEVAEERHELEAASFCLIIRFSCGAVEGRSASANRNDVPRVLLLRSEAAPAGGRRRGDGPSRSRPKWAGFMIVGSFGPYGHVDK